MKDNILIKPIFRYRSDNPEHTIDEIKNNYIYFSNKEQLNDPYDGNERLLEINLKEEKLLDYLKVLKLDVEQFSSTEDLKYFLDNTKKEYLNKFGIACFTISPTNMSLWANYSNNNKGICIEYNIQEDESFFKNLRPIEYLAEYESIDLDLFGNFSELKTILHRKLKLWEHEYELRLLKDLPGKYKVNSNAIKKIIFGLRAEDKFKSKVIETVKKYQPHIQLYNSRLSKDGFAIELAEIKI